MKRKRRCGPREGEAVRRGHPRGEPIVGSVSRNSKSALASEVFTELKATSQRVTGEGGAAASPASGCREKMVLNSSL